MSTILLISGSASTPSVNTEALNEAAAWISAETQHTPVLLSAPLGQIPFYSLQAELEGEPAAVVSLRAQVQQADALIFFTPQYNWRFPALLQNALAWLSRGEYRHILTGKPTGIVSVSPGPRGGAKANADLAEHLSGPFKARVLGPAVVIGDSEAKKEAGGVFAPEHHGAELEELVTALAAAAEAPAEAPAQA